MWLFFFWWSGPAGRRGCPQQRDLSRQTRFVAEIKSKKSQANTPHVFGRSIAITRHSRTHEGGKVGKSGNTWKMFLSRRCTRVRIQSRRRGIDAMKSPKLELSAQNGCSMLAAKKNCPSFCIPKRVALNMCGGKHALLYVRNAIM